MLSFECVGQLMEGVAMGGKTRRAVAELGYSVIHTDGAAQIISFNTGRSMSSWAGQDLTASVFQEGDGSRVVVGGSMATRGNPFGGGSQLVSWGEKEKLSNRFLDVLHMQLSRLPTASPAEPDTPASDDPVEQLRKLGELRDSGVITPEQFETKREELLRRI